ncbi:MAG TPA: hypothetical protein VGP64_12225, partial [Polyangia bacterium]
MPPEISEEERKLIREWFVEENARLEPILEALEGATPSLLRKSLTDQVIKKTSLQSDILDSAVPMFFSLVSTITNADDEAAAIRSIFHTAVGQPADAEKLRLFEERVRRLVRIRSVEITSKA